VGGGGEDVLFAAFEAVEGDDDFGDYCAGLGDVFDGFDDLAAGGDDVFDEDDEVAGEEFAFDGFGGAVVFLGVADDEEGDAGGERGGGGEGDGAEFRAGDALGAGGEAFGDFLRPWLGGRRAGFRRDICRSRIWIFLPERRVKSPSRRATALTRAASVARSMRGS